MKFFCIIFIFCKLLASAWAGAVVRAGNMAEGAREEGPEEGQHLLMSQGAAARPGLGLGHASMQSLDQG